MSSFAQSATTTPAAPIVVAQAGTPSASGLTQGDHAESIVVRAQKRLQKEKNAPSAVTELGAKDIQAVGSQGSLSSLLRMAPSVNSYQQGIGQNSPVLSIRGTRGLETAQTLDGVPTQDLIFGGTGSYLTNNIGSSFGLDQIDSVSIYPGVAYPNRTTFGTIGGTIAYNSKRPTNNAYLDLFASYGSFQTATFGFEANSGAVDGPLGSGDNAPKVLLRYMNEQTGGFIDYTDARYADLLFTLDKPYNDGLSKLQLTAIYNTGRGYLQNQPTPLPDLQKYGMFTNYSKDDAYLRQENEYGTFIVKDDNQITDNLNLGVTAFYIESDNENDSYENNKYFQAPNTDGYTFGAATSPFAQLTFPSFYGGPGVTYGSPGSTYYSPGIFTYNPSKFGYNPTSCYSCGLNYETGFSRSDTYGIQPRGIYDLDLPFVTQVISFGGILARETSPNAGDYVYGTANMPYLNGYNSAVTTTGGAQRTIYAGYLQDKFNFLDDTLHITPGFTLEGTYSSNRQYPEAINPSLTRIRTVEKFDRDFLPFGNIAYDFRDVLPALSGLTAYGSYGRSALFAPVTDFTFNRNTKQTIAPYAAIVHLYEGGLNYSTSKILFHADYFYQEVTRDFGFFQAQGEGNAGLDVYNNDGGRAFKGVEAAATFQVTPEIQLFANISHQLAKYTRSDAASTTVQEDQFGYAFAGDDISGVPNWLSNFGADFDRKNFILDNDEFKVHFTGAFTGSQPTTTDLPVICNGATVVFKNKAQSSDCQVNGLIPYGSDQLLSVNGKDISNLTLLEQGFLGGATIPDDSFRLGSYTTFNLDISYTLPTPGLFAKKLTFDMNIQNLFNHKYYQYYYNQVIAYGGEYQSNAGHSPYSDAIPGEPLAGFLTVTARF